MDWLLKLVLDLGSAGFEFILARSRSRRRRADALRPTVNRITIRLGELAEQVDELWKRQWEMSYGEYEPPPSPDRFEELAEDAAEVSVAAGRAARDLLRNLDQFARDMESQVEIAEERVRRELWERPIDPEAGVDEFFLIENRRYHLWQQHLYDVEDHLGRLAKALSKSADSEAQEFLEGLVNRGRVERIADQAFEAILAGFERGARR